MDLILTRKTNGLVLYLRFLMIFGVYTIILSVVQVKFPYSMNRFVMILSLFKCSTRQRRGDEGVQQLTADSHTIWSITVTPTLGLSCY